VPARSRARKRAVDILFEADQRGTDPVATLADRLAGDGPPVPEYAVTLVEGVAANRRRIDELIAANAVGWTLERMPPVDRTVLRLAVYELLWCDDVPEGVVIAEAVELADRLSTAESSRFVNGLLARIAELWSSRSP
jgi:transcription antitermination protein NusB